MVVLAQLGLLRIGKKYFPFDNVCFDISIEARSEKYFKLETEVS